jgi:hypothetical protein
MIYYWQTKCTTSIYRPFFIFPRNHHSFVHISDSVLRVWKFPSVKFRSSYPKPSDPGISYSAELLLVTEERRSLSHSLVAQRTFCVRCLPRVRTTLRRMENKNEICYRTEQHDAAMYSIHQVSLYSFNVYLRFNSSFCFRSCGRIVMTLGCVTSGF